MIEPRMGVAWRTLIVSQCMGIGMDTIWRCDEDPMNEYKTTKWSFDTSRESRSLGVFKAYYL